MGGLYQIVILLYSYRKMIMRNGLHLYKPYYNSD